MLQTAFQPHRMLKSGVHRFSVLQCGTGLEDDLLEQPTRIDLSAINQDADSFSQVSVHAQGGPAANMDVQNGCSEWLFVAQAHLAAHRRSECPRDSPCRAMHAS